VRPLPAPSARAFTLPRGAPRRRGAALLLHGYTGTPYEVRVLADDLHDQLGLACHAPLLPGHGDDPAALNHVSADDWLDAAVAAYDLADALDQHEHNERRPRVVVGSSMGGLLALQLALVRPVSAIVLLAPALRLFQGATASVMALSLGLWRARPFVIKESAGGDVGADDAQRSNPTYKVLPTRGLTQLLALQWRTERILHEVKAPLCTFHGDRDTTIDAASSRLIARRVASDVVEHHRLRQTQHLVGLDVERDLVSRLACDFVARCLSPSAAFRAQKKAAA